MKISYKSMLEVNLKVNHSYCLVTNIYNYMYKLISFVVSLTSSFLYYSWASKVEFAVHQGIRATLNWARKGRLDWVSATWSQKTLKREHLWDLTKKHDVRRRGNDRWAHDVSWLRMRSRYARRRPRLNNLFLEYLK